MHVTALANTHAAFDALMSRWSALHDAHTSAGDHGVEHMRLARHLLDGTLSGYLPWMVPEDLALYQQLQQARDADELGALFFRCFDLMVRTRGMAVAVLRVHELFRLLQPHITR